MGGLTERAERLVRAVDAIGAGVADTAALLSPRTKVLQADNSAPELGKCLDTVPTGQANAWNAAQWATSLPPIL